MSACLFPGSFDPPTTGHMDLIARAAAIFGEVIVAVMINREKRPAFSHEERVDMLSRAAAEAGLRNVRVVSSDGLTAALAREMHVDVLVRGLRGESDCAAEQWLAAANRKLGGVETLLLFTAPELAYVSSTLVRDAASHGAPLDGMAPTCLIDEIQARLSSTTRA